jgi:DNA-binding HxlR family transcriptional regulator
MDGQEEHSDVLSQSTLLKHLTSKWTPLLLVQLSDNPVTFGKLRRKIPRISQRMLTHTLRNLENEGMVKRNVLPTYPPSVEYQLTDLGAAFRDKVISLNAWAKEINTAKKSLE